MTVELTEREAMTIWESLKTQWAHLAHDRRDTVECLAIEQVSIRESIAVRALIERFDEIVPETMRHGRHFVQVEQER